MSNKILYSPKEGTTGFWFNGVEIVNGDEVIGQFRYHTNAETILNPGDLLDIPIGYEFKSYKKCQHNGIHNSTCIYHEVLRLVKTETKDNITAKQTDIEWLSELLSNFDSGPLSQDQCVTLIMKRFEAPQPEPEESQTLFTREEVYKVISWMQSSLDWRGQSTSPPVLRMYEESKKTVPGDSPVNNKEN